MSLNRIEKPQWQPYFDRVSAALGGKRMEIDIVGPRLGSQPQARQVALSGLSYDHKGDVFVVIGEGIEHNIQHPQQIHVEEELDTVRTVEVVDQSGDHHIIKLKDPLFLPPVAH